jgi:hypothetical protein
LIEVVKVAAQLLLPFSMLFGELRTKKGVYIGTSQHVDGGVGAEPEEF